MPTTNTTQSFDINGMHCASCANVITRQLKKLDGVSECEVNYGTEKAKVTFDPQRVELEKMNQVIGKYGYALNTHSSAQSNHMHEGQHTSHMDHGEEALNAMDASPKARKLLYLRSLKQKVVVSIPQIFISVALMSYELFSDTLGILPMMSETMKEFFHHLLPVFATYMLVVVGQPYLKAVVSFLKNKVANMDTLVGIGTSVAFLYSFILSAFELPLASLIDTSHSYYDVVIVVIGFITLGKYLETKSKLKTGEAIEKLIGLQAKKALVLRDNKEIEIDVAEVVVGDVVIVKPGQKIPVDGTIIEGSTSIDESMITGESIPVDKKIDDTVIGATINKQGSIRIKTTQVGSETVLAQIIKMVEDAQGSKAPIEKLADQISAIFVPIVLILAIIVFLAWIIIGSQFMPFSQALSLAIVNLVAILVIACPCAMGLATPTAVIVGVGKAAQNGILIRNAESLERFSKVDTIVFDKTGTLTNGTPKVTDVQSTSELSETNILQLLYSLEKHSEHPLASAIVEKAIEQKISPLTVTDFSNLEGKGVSGVINATKYYAGNHTLATQLKVRIDDSIIDQFSTQGKTPILLMNDTHVLAYIGVADTIKDDAKSTVETLHSLGLSVAMLTGDHQKTAEHIANLLGIDQVIAQVLPKDKANQVEKLQAQHKVVAMIGDGINDAPALATADVGVAMGTGTDVAIESAGITLLGGHISKLPKSYRLAKATMSTIKQNLFWAFFYNVISIPIAAGLLYPIWGILLNPAIAGGAMAFSSVSVVLNALRLKRIKL